MATSKRRRWRDDIHVEHPGRPSAAMVRFVRTVLRPCVRLAHRPVLEGLEHLPRSGPYILVANHSAGMAISEIMSFLSLYLEAVGPERPLAGFAHPLGLLVFPSSVILRHAGAIPSTYTAAEATLGRGIPILVFPGGDHESLRPLWQAHRVDFAGRVGFLRIAQKLRVPIVPMGIRGSHFTAPVLFRSPLLPWLLLTPRLLGMRRWGVTLLGVLGAAALLAAPGWDWWWRALAAYAWLASPFTLMPWIPWTIRFRIGAPIPPEALFSAASPADDAALAGALEVVEARVQALVLQEAAQP